mgnify:FL=1
MRIFIFLILIIWNTAANTQVITEFNSQAEKVFIKALRFYESNNYRDAYLLFDSLSRLKPIHQRTTASYLMSAKCLQRMKSYRASIALINEFIQVFPISNYIADAYYSLGVSYIFKQDYKNAGSCLLLSLGIEKNISLREQIITLFESIADHRLEIDDLKSLVESADSLLSKDLASIKLAEKYRDKNDIHKAKNILNSLESRHDKSFFYDRIINTLKYISNGTVKIAGVVFPVTEDAQPPSVRLAAMEIIEGMKYALDEYDVDGNKQSKWSLDIRKVNHTSEESVKMVRELAADPRICVVVGPLSLDAAKNCAEIARREEIPLILPNVNIEPVGNRDYVFQIKPDLQTEGKIMARFAVRDLNLKTFAILSSDDKDAVFCAENFSREVQRLGGKILVYEKYGKDESDLREQFINIRKAGFRHVRVDELAENIDKPMKNIDGIFISVGNKEEIGIVASQLSYYNIKSQIIGNSRWDDRSQLQKNQLYINGIIYGTTSFYDELEKEVQEFKKLFYNLTKKYPSSHHAFGYDIMNLLLSLNRTGDDNRKSIFESLLKVKYFHGLRTTVTFNNMSINSRINIVEFKGGEVRKIEDKSTE